MEKPNSGHEHLKKTHVVDEKEIQWIFKKKNQAVTEGW